MTPYELTTDQLYRTDFFFAFRLYFLFSAKIIHS